MNAELRHSIFTLLVQAAAMISLSGCAQQPVDETAATAEAGYGRAFGRIEYLEDGKETAWNASEFFGDSLVLYVRPVGGGELKNMVMEGDGTFYWLLPAGEYVIVGYRMTRRRFGSNPVTSDRLMTTFSVPQAGQAFYIGDLRIETVKSRSRIRVVDRYDAALKRADPRIAGPRFGAVKALMRLEQPPGRFTRVTGICSPSWGLQCDSSYQGVRPIEPWGTASTFAGTRSLAPRLEWQPSSRRDLTYDVAIYEFVPIGNRGLRGTLVAYAEGLREPSYTPAPLEHWQKYEWTVRLRDGDTVSNWSTTSYNFFAVVAWGRGSGQYFGFETPKK
jgi:hypothetical protein